MMRSKPWLLVLLFLVFQVIITVVYTNVTVNGWMNSVAVWAAVLLCSVGLNFLLSGCITSLAALLPGSEISYRVRYKALFPLILCVFAVLIAGLFIATDYV